jgi:hypothetical protein
MVTKPVDLLGLLSKKKGKWHICQQFLYRICITENLTSLQIPYIAWSRAITSRNYMATMGFPHSATHWPYQKSDDYEIQWRTWTWGSITTTQQHRIVQSNKDSRWQYIVHQKWQNTWDRKATYNSTVYWWYSRRHSLYHHGC